jgi:hypothetical protein
MSGAPPDVQLERGRQGNIPPGERESPVNAIPGFRKTGFGKLPLSAIVNLVLAVLLSAWSGFFTMDFLLSGIYTWPRSSRVVTLTAAVIILVYEFIYKEHQARHAAVTNTPPLKLVVYTCMIPYMLGTLVLLVLISRV